MITEFYFLLTWILGARFILLFSEPKTDDTPKGTKISILRNFGAFLLPLIGLLAFSFQPKIIYSALVLGIAGIIRILLSKRSSEKPYPYGLHFLSIVIQIIVIGFLFHAPNPIEFSDWVKNDIYEWVKKHPLINENLTKQIPTGLIVLSGLLFAANEVNLLVRSICLNMGIKPNTSSNPTTKEWIFQSTHPEEHPSQKTFTGTLKEQQPTQEDEGSLNSGRTIGVLERAFVYFFVISGNYTAIGFIVAAKGMARFKKLDDRIFAEYFLVGTLLSVFFSALTALFVTTLIGA